MSLPPRFSPDAFDQRSSPAHPYYNLACPPQERSAAFVPGVRLGLDATIPGVRGGSSVRSRCSVTSFVILSVNEHCSVRRDRVPLVACPPVLFLSSKYWQASCQWHPPPTRTFNSGHALAFSCFHHAHGYAEGIPSSKPPVPHPPLYTSDGVKPNSTRRLTMRWIRGRSLLMYERGGCSNQSKRS